MQRLNYLIIAIFIFSINDAMAFQLAEPDQDLENPKSWTTAPLWSKIDNAGLANDYTDYIISNLLTSPSGVNISLADLLHPEYNQTGHIVRIRAREQDSGGQTIEIRGKIYDGYTWIHTGSLQSIGTNFGDFSWTFSSFDVERARPTDYKNWILEIYADGNLVLPRDNAEISEADLRVPDYVPYPSILSILKDGMLTIREGGQLTIKA